MAQPGAEANLRPAEEHPEKPIDLDIEGFAGDPVRIYLNDIGKTALLSAEQEVELSKRIEAGLYASYLLGKHKAGDVVPEALRSGATPEELQDAAHDGQQAKAQFLAANLRLVVSVAKRYVKHGGLPLPDLIQEGNLGLIRAVEKFDYTRGYKFSTYAMWWIRQSITRGKADLERLIRLPVNVIEDINKVEASQRTLMQQFGREATPEELAKETGLPLQKVLQALQQKKPISLDTPLDGSDKGGRETVFGDLVADADAVDLDKVVEQQALQKDLQSVMGSLNPREEIIIKLRFGLTDGVPRTLDQIGKLLGVTRERVRQIEKNVLKKLRDPSRASMLRTYVTETK